MPKIVITEESLSRVVHLIKTWKGKLTWPLLCERVSLILGTGSITRQTLSSYKMIQEAYSEKKIELRNETGTKPSTNTNIDFLLNQIESLEAELESANKTINQYKERFARWQYNAYMNGMRVETLDDAHEMLDKPLVSIDRRTGGN